MTSTEAIEIKKITWPSIDILLNIIDKSRSSYSIIPTSYLKSPVQGITKSGV